MGVYCWIASSKYNMGKTLLEPVRYFYLIESSVEHSFYFQKFTVIPVYINLRFAINSGLGIIP